MYSIGIHIVISLFNDFISDLFNDFDSDLFRDILSDMSNMFFCGTSWEQYSFFCLLTTTLYC